MKYLEHILQYKRDELYHYAKTLDIKGISTLKKKELAEKIAPAILDKEALFNRLLIYSDTAIEIVRKAQNMPYFIGEEEKAAASFITATSLGRIVNEQSLIMVDEIEACTWINDPEFEQKRKEMVWLLDCMRTACAVYWTFEPYVLASIYNQKGYLKRTTEEIREMLNRVPLDFSFWEYDEKLNLIFPKSEFKREEIAKLFKKQNKYSYYMLKPSDVEAFVDKGFWFHSAPYSELIEFMMKELGLNEEQAAFQASEMNVNLCGGTDVVSILRILLNQLEFKNESQINTMIDLVLKSYNDTRMIRYRGHTPIEIRIMNPDRCDNDITLGSIAKAAILEKLQPELESKGLYIYIPNGKISNLDELKQVAVKRNKIYPNSPCPCGSGKKYKKCCGR